MKKPRNKKEEQINGEGGPKCFIENGSRFLIQDVNMNDVPEVGISSPVKTLVLP